jgi:hypothetical protein
MNFTNKHKLYFNVILLFIFSYLLTAKIIDGIKTQEFNYLRIGINILVVGLTIKSIIKYNNED